jgi:outer membrane protein TolC
MSETSEARASALRWEVAGQLRHLLWAMAASQNQLLQTEAELENTRLLTKSVARRHELGDVPEGDLLLARNALLEAQTRHVNAEAALLDAERAYQSLTTLTQRPAFTAEPLSPQKSIAPDHPALLLANTRLERAQAKLRLAEKSSKGSPRLLIGPRRERASFADEFDDSIGLTLTVPFGGAHAQTETAGVAREVAAALASRDRTLRALDLQLHEAIHELSVADEKLTIAIMRKDLAARRYSMAQRAHELGEIELLDLLKLQSVAQQAERDANQLLIDKKYQTALYNQAVGALP